MTTNKQWPLIFLTYGDYTVDEAEQNKLKRLKKYQRLNDECKSIDIPRRKYDGLIASVDLLVALSTIALVSTLTPFITQPQYREEHVDNLAPEVVLILLMACGLIFIFLFARSRDAFDAKSYDKLMRKSRFDTCKGADRILFVAGLVLFYTLSFGLDFFHIYAQINCGSVWILCGETLRIAFIIDILFHIFRMIFFGCSTFFAIVYRSFTFASKCWVRYSLAALFGVNLALWFDVLLHESARSIDNNSTSDKQIQYENITIWCMMQNSSHRYASHNFTVQCFEHSTNIFNLLNDEVVPLCYPFMYECCVILSERFIHWFCHCKKQTRQTKLNIENDRRRLQRSSSIREGNEVTNIEENNRNNGIESLDVDRIQSDRNISEETNNIIRQICSQDINNINSIEHSSDEEHCPKKNESLSDTGDEEDEEDEDEVSTEKSDDEENQNIFSVIEESTNNSTHTFIENHLNSNLISDNNGIVNLNQNNNSNLNNINVTGSLRTVLRSNNSTNNLLDSTGVCQYCPVNQNQDGSICQHQMSFSPSIQTQPLPSPNKRRKNFKRSVDDGSDLIRGENVTDVIDRNHVSHRRTPRRNVASDRSMVGSFGCTIFFLFTISTNVLFFVFSILPVVLKFEKPDEKRGITQLFLYYTIPYYLSILISVIYGFTVAKDFPLRRSNIINSFQGLDYLLLISASGPFAYNIFSLVAACYQPSVLNLSGMNALGSVLIQIINILEVYVQIPFCFFAGRVTAVYPDGSKRPKSMHFQAVLIHVSVCNVTLWLVNSFATTYNNESVYFASAYFDKGLWRIINSFILPVTLFFRFNSFLLIVKALRIAFHRGK